MWAKYLEGEGGCGNIYKESPLPTLQSTNSSSLYRKSKSIYLHLLSNKTIKLKIKDGRAWQEGIYWPNLVENKSKKNYILKTLSA